MKPTLEQLRKFFEKDRFAAEAGAQIDEAEDGHAICSLDVVPSHLNAGQAVMGGVLFTLADFAFAVAANYAGSLTVTLNSQISFLRPPRGKRLIAEATCISKGKSVCFYEITITDDQGTLAAKVSVSGYSKGVSIDFSNC